MRDYSADELDLMARAFERAHDQLVRRPVLSVDRMQRDKLSLVDGIVQAFERGERSEERLVRAALGRIEGRGYRGPAVPWGPAAPLRWAGGSL